MQENVKKGLEKLNEKTAEYQKWLKEPELGRMRPVTGSGIEIMR